LAKPGESGITSFHYGKHHCSGWEAANPELYGILWAIAIFWVGIALDLRRLRDAGKSAAAWIFLFFVPLANLVLFLD